MYAQICFYFRISVSDQYVLPLKLYHTTYNISYIQDDWELIGSVDKYTQHRSYKQCFIPADVFITICYCYALFSIILALFHECLWMYYTFQYVL